LVGELILLAEIKLEILDKRGDYIAKEECSTPYLVSERQN